MVTRGLTRSLSPVLGLLLVLASMLRGQAQVTAIRLLEDTLIVGQETYVLMSELEMEEAGTNAEGLRARSVVRARRMSISRFRPVVDGVARLTPLAERRLHGNDLNAGDCSLVTTNVVLFHLSQQKWRLLPIANLDPATFNGLTNFGDVGVVAGGGGVVMCDFSSGIARIEAGQKWQISKVDGRSCDWFRSESGRVTFSADLTVAAGAKIGTEAWIAQANGARKSDRVILGGGAFSSTMVTGAGDGIRVLYSTLDSKGVRSAEILNRSGVLLFRTNMFGMPVISDDGRTVVALEDWARVAASVQRTIAGSLWIPDAGRYGRFTLDLGELPRPGSFEK